jgi:hypothetical protein
VVEGERDQDGDEPAVLDQDLLVKRGVGIQVLDGVDVGLLEFLA